MKCISYSLFGYKQKPTQNSFEFVTYLRGFYTGVRVNRVIYPNWEIVLNIDGNSYNSPYRSVFDWLQNKGLININICPDGEALCKAMLWRLKPVFAMQDNKWKYTHVLCRDTDSAPTYRERQMVEEWIAEDKTIHCITDSVSHNIEMMGGMIGIRGAHISSKMGVHSWDQLIKLNPGIDFNRKGSDQDFLNKVIYSKCYDSSTEHFILGMKHNIPEGGGRHYRVPDITLGDVPIEQKATNDLAGHVGASGCYEPVMIRWLKTQDPYEAEYAEIEKQFPQLFFWRE